MTPDYILRNHPFTKGLGDLQIPALAEMARVVSFEAGEVILLEGQRSEGFYLVTEGSVGGTTKPRIRGVRPGPDSRAFGYQDRSRAGTK